MNDILFNPDWDLLDPHPAGRLRICQPTDERVPVIIAEDDPVSRALVTSVIEKAGFRTIVTNDGVEAMSALREQTAPCVAVIDWMMPGMDGAEICRRAREGGRNVYIIMLSARGAKEDTVQAFQDGVDDFMVKPFQRDELIARIRAGLRQLNTRMALQARVDALEEQAPAETLKFQIPL
jgi:DNA-binding response OmpR family regulator